LGAEEAEEVHAAIGVEGESGAGEGRVDEFVVAGMVGGRVLTKVVKAHGRIRKEAALGGSAHQDEKAGVAVITLNSVGEFGDGFFFAFEALHEIAVFVEKHASDADDGVFGAGPLEHVFDFLFGEVF